MIIDGQSIQPNLCNDIIHILMIHDLLEKWKKHDYKCNPTIYLW